MPLLAPVTSARFPINFMFICCVLDWKLSASAVRRAPLGREARTFTHRLCWPISPTDEPLARISRDASNSEIGRRLVEVHLAGEVAVKPVYTDTFTGNPP